MVARLNAQGVSALDATYELLDSLVLEDESADDAEADAEDHA